MWYSLVRIGIILVFFQCTQGVVVRHFDTKRRSGNTEYFFEKHLPRSDNDNKFNFEFNELPQQRGRRQNAGGEPVAVQSSIPDDARQYGRVSYSGEGSQVNYSTCTRYFCYR